MAEYGEITSEQWASWPDDKLLTTVQVGFILSYDQKHVRVLIHRKVLKCVRVGGGSLRMRLGDLKAYIEKHHGRYQSPGKKGNE